MKGLVAVFALVCGSAALTGCLGYASPLVGGIYSDVQGGVAVGSAAGSSKVGEATATGIVGVALGDASIQTAMKNGGITKVHHVDMKAMSVLMVYVKYTTIVYGE